MSSAIHIDHPHRLGLARARALAWAWAERAERELRVHCTVVEDADSDTVEFRGHGMEGRLRVTGDRFRLDARLGWALGLLAHRIQARIETELSQLVQQAQEEARDPGPPGA